MNLLLVLLFPEVIEKKRIAIHRGLGTVLRKHIACA